MVDERPSQRVKGWRRGKRGRISHLLAPKRGARGFLRGSKASNVALTKASEAFPPKKRVKGKYENIPGTRVQAATGGKHVRVIIQDGKSFNPSNVLGARRG